MNPRPRPSLIVIDPSPTVCQVIKLILTRHGYSTLATFADPVHALRALHNREVPVPDIALICRRLPFLDSYEVMQVMRERAYTTQVVILLACEEGILERIKARLAGARAVLLKPFDVKELLLILSTLSSAR